MEKEIVLEGKENKGMGKKTVGFAQNISQRIPDTISGRYQVKEVLDDKNDGAVVSVEDIDSGMTPMICKIYSTKDPEMSTRVLKETKAFSELEHPYLMKVYQTFVTKTSDQQNLLVTVLSKAKSDMQKFLTENPALPLRDLHKLMVQVTLGLKELHRSNLTHLDMEVAHMYVSERGNAWVGNFGKGATTLENLWRTTSMPFTAPEVIQATFPADEFGEELKETDAQQEKESFMINIERQKQSDVFTLALLFIAMMPMGHIYSGPEETRVYNGYDVDYKRVQTDYYDVRFFPCFTLNAPNIMEKLETYNNDVGPEHQFDIEFFKKYKLMIGPFFTYMRHFTKLHPKFQTVRFSIETFIIQQILNNRKYTSEPNITGFTSPFTDLIYSMLNITEEERPNIDDVYTTLTSKATRDLFGYDYTSEPYLSTHELIKTQLLGEGDPEAASYDETPVNFVQRCIEAPKEEELKPKRHYKYHCLEAVKLIFQILLMFVFFGSFFFFHFIYGIVTTAKNDVNISAPYLPGIFLIIAIAGVVLAAILGLISIPCFVIGTPFFQSKELVYQAIHFFFTLFISIVALPISWIKVIWHVNRDPNGVGYEVPYVVFTACTSLFAVVRLFTVFSWIKQFKNQYKLVQSICKHFISKGLKRFKYVFIIAFSTSLFQIVITLMCAFVFHNYSVFGIKTSRFLSVVFLLCVYYTYSVGLEFARNITHYFVVRLYSRWLFDDTQKGESSDLLYITRHMGNNWTILNIFWASCHTVFSPLLQGLRYIAIGAFYCSFLITVASVFLIGMVISVDGAGEDFELPQIDDKIGVIAIVGACLCCGFVIACLCFNVIMVYTSQLIVVVVSRILPLIDKTNITGMAHYRKNYYKTLWFLATMKNELGDDCGPEKPKISLNPFNGLNIYQTLVSDSVHAMNSTIAYINTNCAVFMAGISVLIIWPAVSEAALGFFLTYSIVRNYLELIEGPVFFLFMLNRTEPLHQNQLFFRFGDLQNTMFNFNRKMHSEAKAQAKKLQTLVKRKNLDNDPIYLSNEAELDRIQEEINRQENKSYEV